MPVSSRHALRTAALLAALGLALSGCATTTSGDTGGSGDGGGSGGDAAGGLNCDGATTAGWELMVDPRVTVDPAADVVPLTKEGESLTFTDGGGGEYTTYSYSLGYLDEDGTVFPNDSGILFPEGDDIHVLAVHGPFAPSGVDGGPYAGILQFEATEADAENKIVTTTLARVCVLLAIED
ncbi:hypothetical protein [Protaetiibacter intestinalis]|uniref:DUF4352 domain-containing protein n=1 Tax=Protaetiibacter intestinalis TaxID=2419774 RepID=A0A387BJ62_9MICO|nr:hypothetical protein [Protaetiibacter intestinalis]AYF98570.1 hypothetical protein D7I47_10065 [Protaetiibacter intestinalis]